MGGEQVEKTKTSKKISPPTIARKRSGDEKDFVDDKELMAAVQLGVLKTSDDVCQVVGERNGQDLKFDEEVISRVSALVWDTVVDTWVDDLAAFSNHAARQQVNLDDIAMLTRRNSELFQTVREMTSLGKTTIPTTTTNINNPTKSRKRKSVEPNKEEVEVIEKEKSPEVILAKTPTPCSFLKTPTVKRMTSTPKVGSNLVRAELFVTPIRPSNGNENEEEENEVIQMTRIEEENEEEEEDSFDKIFAGHVASTSSKPNMSSLIRMAEENPLPGENTLFEIEERDRIQAMEPVEEKEEEYDSFEEDIIVENVKVGAKNNTTIKNGTKSPDLFADSSGSNNSTLKNKETSSMTDKSNTVFSKKLTTFNFDEDSMDAPVEKPQKSQEPEVFDIDDEDSFDAPIPNVVAKKSEPRNTPKFIDIDEDSFDAPVKAPDNQSQKLVGQETPKNVPIPKWRVTKEKWTNMKPVASPSSSQTSQKSTTPRRNNLSMNNDSFDEFDFDV